MDIVIGLPVNKLLTLIAGSIAFLNGSVDFLPFDLKVSLTSDFLFP